MAATARGFVERLTHRADPPATSAIRFARPGAILDGMPRSPGRAQHNHRAAAQRHQEAAENHDRAARFWAEQNDPDRAALQREMAEYEQRGAELELRWAELVERDSK